MDEKTTRTDEELAIDLLELSEEDIEESPDPIDADQNSEVVENEPEVSTQTSSESEPQRHTIRYNGEDKELTLDELKTLAQKGMNYDHVLQERDSARNNPVLRYVERIAKEAGLTSEELIAKMEQAQKQAIIDENLQKGIPPEIAARLAELETNERVRLAEEEQRRMEEARKSDFAEVYQAYPDLNELPTEVLDTIMKGEKPINAYRAYALEKEIAEKQRLQAELEALKNNEKNKEKALSSSQGDASAEITDDFLSGLFG